MLITFCLPLRRHRQMAVTVPLPSAPVPVGQDSFGRIMGSNTAHWLGQASSVLGTVAACCGGVATANATQAPSSKNNAQAAIASLLAMSLHLASAYISNNGAQGSSAAPVKWSSSVFVVLLAEIGAALVTQSSKMAEGADKTLYLGGGIACLVAAGFFVTANHASGLAAKFEADFSDFANRLDGLGPATNQTAPTNLAA